MKVTFTYTPADVRALRLAFAMWRLQIPALIIISPVLPLTLLALRGQWRGVAVGGFTAVLFLFWVVRRMWIQERKIPDRVAGPHELELLPSGVYGHNEWGWAYRGWKQVFRVISTPAHTMIANDWKQFNMVPHRAFEKPGEVQMFADKAYQSWQRARHENTAPIPEMIRDRIPQSSPLAEVSYIYRGNLAPITMRWIVQRIVFLLLGSLMIMVVSEQMGIIGYVGFAFLTVWLTLIVFEGTAILWERLGQRLYGKESEREYRMTLHPTGVMVNSDGIASFTSWANVESTELGASFVAFYTARPHLFAVIPKRAFTSGDAAESFVDTAQDLIRQAQQVDVVANLADDDASEESGNPYQTPRY